MEFYLRQGIVEDKWLQLELNNWVTSNMRITLELKKNSKNIIVVSELHLI